MEMKRRPAGRAAALRRAGAVAATLVLVLTGWAALLGLGLERTLYCQDYYRHLARELDFYRRLQVYLVESLKEELPAGSALLLRALEKTLDVAWLEKQGDGYISETAAFLRGERERLVLVLPLEERMAVFRDALAAGALATVPPGLSGPPAALLEELIAYLGLPEAVTLLEVALPVTPGEGDGSAAEALLFLRQSRRFFRTVPFLGFALAALFCLLWAGLSRGLKWLGAAMVFSAALYLALLPAARAWLLAPRLALLAGREPYAAFFPEGPAALEQALNGTLSLLAESTLYYAAAGILFLAAGLAAARWQRAS